MKFVAVLQLAISLSLFIPESTYAQCSDSKLSLVYEFLSDSVTPRTATWWNALGSQLALSLESNDEKLNAEAMKYIIYFASNYSEKVILNDTTDSLLYIYKEQDNDAVRMMVVAALHAIGDKTAMASLNELVIVDESSKVRHIAAAAMRYHSIGR